MKQIHLYLLLFSACMLLALHCSAQPPGCQATIHVGAGPGGTDTFSATGNFSPLTATLTWEWGDGTVIRIGNNLTHTYQFDDSFLVCLTISDTTVPCSDTICAIAAISRVACSSQIFYNHFDTTFSVFSRSTGFGPYSYLWTLPNGTTSTFPNPAFTLPFTGTQSILPVSVIVTDPGGCIDTAFSNIYTDSVLHPSNICQAYFFVVPDTSIAGGYYAINISVGDSLSYTWSFGDGHSSQQEYPTHTYAIAGYYTICLTVMDSADGCTSSFCDSGFYAFKNFGGPMSSISVLPGNGTTGIAGIISNDLPDIYPNPAHSFIEIRLKSNDNVEHSVIYNSTGQKMAEYNSSTHLMISNLSVGLYFIDVKSGGSIYHCRFAKQD